MLLYPVRTGIKRLLIALLSGSIRSDMPRMVRIKQFNWLVRPRVKAV